MKNDENGALKHLQTKEEGRNAVHLIGLLREVKGARAFTGECSFQVILPVADGGFLRIGITDDDVANDPFALWWDRYNV